jgi:hypothetical protein
MGRNHQPHRVPVSESRAAVLDDTRAKIAAHGWTVQAENPTHRMAGMLDHALQNGVRPEEIRGLLAGLPPAVSV